MPINDPANPVLIAAPIGQDALLIADTLQSQGIHVRICSSLDECARGISASTAAIVLTEEALENEHLGTLRRALASQPEWSELPIIVLASAGEAHWNTLLELTTESPGALILLERPLEPQTLSQSVRVALRSRRRQLQVHNLLEDQQRSVRDREHRAAELEQALKERTAEIAARRQAEKALRDSEERFRTLANATPALIWVNGPQGAEFVNRTYLEFLGVNPPDVKGFEWTHFVHPEDRERYVSEYLQAVDRRVQFDAEFRFRRHDGVWRWMRSVAQPRLSEQDEFLGYAGVTTDITAQREAELILRESEQRFRMLADNIPQLAWMCDQLGSVTWYNQRWIDYTGLALDELKDWGWTKCHHPDHVDRVIASVTRSRETGEIWEDTFPLRGKDGQYRWFLSRAYPIRNEVGAIIRWFGTNTDITDQRKAEDVLRRHQDILEQSVQQRTEEVMMAQRRLAAAQRMAAVGTLAAGLAHDMNNLLLPLGARLDMLLTHMSVDGATHDHLTAVKGLMGHLREMARSLSLFARDPEKEGVIGRTDLADWRSKAWRFIEASIRGEPGTGAAAIELRCDFAPQLPDVAIAPHRFTQVVQNLMHNARDAVLAKRAASDAAGEQYRGCIVLEIRPASESQGVMVSVIDDGQGMDEETLRRCIEPFYTTRDRSTVPSGQGTGMGLSLAHQIIERTGGSMQIESTAGQGTRITITLPLSQLEESQPSSTRSDRGADVPVRA